MKSNLVIKYISLCLIFFQSCTSEKHEGNSKSLPNDSLSIGSLSKKSLGKGDTLTVFKAISIPIDSSLLTTKRDNTADTKAAADGIDHSMIDTLITVIDTNIKTDRWVDFERYVGGTKHILSIKGKDELTFYYQFQIIKDSVVNREFSGEVTRVPRRSAIIPLKYRSTSRGPIFEDLDSSKELVSSSSLDNNTDYRDVKIVIEQDSSRYASFTYISEGEQQVFPELIRVGAIEPYNKYLAKIIEPIRNFKAAIDRAKKSKDGHIYGSEKFQAKYNKLISDVWKILDQNDVDGASYLIQTDTILFEEIRLSKLDSVFNILQSKGFVYPEDPPLVNSYIAKGYPYKTAITYNFLTNSVVKIEQVSNIRDRKKSKRFSLSESYVSSQSFLQFGETVICMLTSGFETVTHVFTQWEITGDSLKFIRVLDGSVSVGIGELNLEHMVITPDKRRFFFGNTFGGDGGDTWGSMWVGEWTESNQLKTVFEKKYSGQEIYRDFQYEFLNDSIFRLKTMQKYAKKDSTLSVDLINMNEF